MKRALLHPLFAVGATGGIVLSMALAFGTLRP